MEKKTILVIDDDPVILELLCEILRVEGFKTLAASSCSAAIEIYKNKKNEIDQIILDLILPEVSGFECMNRLFDINPEAKIIIYSGAASIYTLQDLTLRVKGILTKPCTRKELLDMIKK